ncbi:MAG: hypothetical protein FJZ79_02790 [Chlorobi bacterium]|nr:hypothetical protein [Chlorobiota bacterium]
MHLCSLVFKHWLKLLYLFEMLLLAAGFLFLNEHVQRLGLSIAGVTAALHISFLWVRDIVLSGKRVSMSLKSIAVFLVFVLVVSGPVAFFLPLPVFPVNCGAGSNGCTIGLCTLAQGCGSDDFAFSTFPHEVFRISVV